MKSSILFLLFLLNFIVFGQNETHVTIETEGHMALVKSVVFSPNGKLLYSVSDDKTLRVWDVENKILLKTYRGYIDVGQVGLLASSAISPDGKTIAVGGILGKSHKDFGSIRLIDTRTGEVKNIIVGHESSVVALEFTPDGKFLISGSNDGNVGLWNVKTLEGGGLTGHNSGVYGLAISPDMSTLVSGGDDGKMIVWQLNKILYEQKLEYKEITKHTDKAEIAFSPNGDYFVSVSEDNYIYLWKKNGKFVKQIDELLDPTYGKQSNFCDALCVSFTADGTKIVVGAQKSETKQNVHVYEIPSGKKIGEFREHTNSVLSVDIHGNDLVATSGGNDREIILWNLTTGKILATFKGKGKSVFKVAAGPNNTIAFGTLSNKLIEINKNGRLNKKFSLSTMEYLGESTDFTGYVSEITKTEKLEITAESFSKVKISNGKSITLNYNDAGNLRCMTITPDNRIVLGTTFGLFMYSSEGEFIQKLVGHSGEVYSLACSFDGRFLFSSSVDQTIRIWDLKEEGVLIKTYDQYIDELGSDERQWLVDRYGSDYLKDLYDQGYKKEITPIASLFVSAENEWICWNKSNYYATSQHGSQFVGFHKNNGFNKKADFLTFEQFDLKYNRPDLLLTSLQTNSDTSLIELYHRAYLKRLEKLNINESEIDLQDAAPSLQLKTSSQAIDGNEITIKMFLSDEEKKLSRLFISMNGIPIYGLKGKDISNLDTTKLDFEVTEKLIPGKNRIQVWCTNSAGVKSNREMIIVFSTSAQSKPTLYLLGIGASVYQDEQWNLNYAKKDVRDFVNFYTTSNSLYGKIIVDTLMNEDVTLPNIKTSLQKLKTSEVSDHVIIFLAGHGVLNAELDYFLATYDMNFNAPEKNGFAYSFLESEIETIPARTKTIFIDACHGGELDKSSMELTDNRVAEEFGDVKFRSVGSAVEVKSGVSYVNSFSMMKNIFTDLRESSGATIIASAGGSEFAFEGDTWKNGVFTYCMLEGLKNKSADLNKDGTIYLSELQHYVQSKVSELTGGKQQPISRYENINNDHIFWK